MFTHRHRAVRDARCARVFPCAQVRGLTRVPVRSEEEALGQFFLGEQGRTTAGHVLNAESSRSHTVFTLHLEVGGGCGREACLRARAAPQQPRPTTARYTSPNDAASQPCPPGFAPASPPANPRLPLPSPHVPPSQTRTSEAASERALLSKLNLVDLAGSERTKKTGVTGGGAWEGRLARSGQAAATQGRAAAGLVGGRVPAEAGAKP